ncbi:MAG: hypothetical protein ACI35P_06265 [Bacillus sp. (in: firmicutes)]
MISFVVVVSIVLNCISLLAIIILFLRQNQYKESEKSLKNLKKEFDEILQSYLLEMTEENNKIAAALALIKQNDEFISSENALSVSGANGNNDYDNPIKAAEKKPLKQSAGYLYNEDNQEQIHYEPPYETVRDTVEIAYTAPPVVGDEDRKNILFKQTLSEQISKVKEGNVSKEEMAIFMRNEGYSVDEIAKKLNKGKTEVDLLLRFHSKTIE